ncbi:MAG: glycoside hydrolase family 92 protein, partial [Muribaculaceae bacterium]|nr:glycoside hydrolase family 92 protein [Muribaculaceae bacterium]
AYRNAVDGLCGNEDVGQMSAWYILAASGFHPLCPGTPEYEITSPIFDRVTYNLPSGKQFVVETDRPSPEAIYIDKVTLNGKPVDGTVIGHSDIMDGGTLHFKLKTLPD